MNTNEETIKWTDCTLQSKYIHPFSNGSQAGSQIVLRT